MLRNCSYIILFVACSLAGWHCGNRQGGHDASPATGEGHATVSPGIDSAVLARFRDGILHENGTDRPRLIKLADSSEVVLNAKTKLRVSREFGAANRDVQLDGEAWFDVKAKAGKPFVIFTRCLQIEVLGTRFRVDAFASNAGEEVDLLEGKLRVQKSYHSTTDNEPEFLQAGEMVMINRDIDLMEKEKLDSAELKKLEGGKF